MKMKIATCGAALVLLLMVSVTRAQNGQSCRTKEGTAGICGPISNCPALRSLLDLVRNRNAPQGTLQRLRDAICSFSNSVPLVCCPGSVSLPGPGQPLPVTPSPPQPGNDGGLRPQRCGISAVVDRIIEGEDAPLLAWPWMVLFRGRVNRTPSTWFCGGVLINYRYILSAAHCFKEGLVELEYVRIGEHTLSRNPDCEKGLCAPSPQDIKVEEIIRHPRYGNPCQECNDIALVRLSTPATLHPLHVVPICLPVNPQQELGFSSYQGKFGYAAGWGSTSRDPSRVATPDKLQQVQLPIQTLDFCRSRLQVGYDDPRMTFCAGGEGKDTCRGDSGGPLVLSNNQATRYYVVGITSLGPVVCGSAATQGLYTNVNFYVNWIHSTMRP